MLTSRRKLSFIRRKIVENVRMIELDVVDHEELRQVVDELGAFVKKGTVIFVTFDYEMV